MLRVATAFLFLATTVSAQDAAKPLPADHPATKRWDQSKETYSQAVEGHKKAFLKFMQGVEDRARADGDTEKVKQIVSERDAFEKTGAIPKSVKTATYQKDLETARTVLSKEAKAARSAFLTAKFDDAATTVDAEAKAILGGPEQKNVDKPATDAREEWKAADSPNRWVHDGGKEWQELGGGGKADRFWDEQTRTSKFVELKFRKSKDLLRLYDDHADANYGKGFGRWGGGKWIVSPPASELISRENISVVIMGTDKDRMIVISVKCDQDTAKKLGGAVTGTDGFKREFRFKSTEWKDGTATHSINHGESKRGDILELRLSQVEKPLARVELDDLIP